MNEIARRRVARREGRRLIIGAALMLVAFAGGVAAVATGQQKWLLLAACVPLAGMCQWAEDCPRCGRRLRPAVMATDGDEVCRRCGEES